MEDNGMEFVWGLLAGDDFTARLECGPYTMNDIELIHWTDTDTYTVSIETGYTFKNKQDMRVYLLNLLRAFTAWMQEQGYNTRLIIPINIMFGENNGHFATIEEAYADFKIKVLGWIAN